jgi:hypothetical protein
VALVEAVADVDRQVVVDRALGDALQSLDADVADREIPGIATAAPETASTAAMPVRRSASMSLRHQPKSLVMSL